MRCKGTLDKINLNFGTGRREITLTVDARPEELERYQGKELSIEIKRYRDKRSLEANAYYWQLVSKISEEIGESAPWIHNQALRKCAYIETFGGFAIYVKVPFTDEEIRKVDEDETIHLMPTDDLQEAEDGSLERVYMKLRGSSTYDTKEMSHLIDTVVEWAKDLGIDPDTPDQLEEMRTLWQRA